MRAVRRQARAVPRQTKTRDRFGRPRPVAREQEGALHYTTLQGEYSSMDGRVNDPGDSRSEMIRSLSLSFCFDWALWFFVCLDLARFRLYAMTDYLRVLA